MNNFNSHKTARQNLLKKQKSSGSWSMLIVALLAAVQLFMSLQFFGETGVTTLSCQQTQMTQVQCEINRSKYLGLIQEASTYLTEIKAAKFDEKNTSDRNGESQVDYVVSLVNTDEQEFVIFQDLIFINNVRGNAGEMEAIAREINSFIDDQTQSSFTISRDLRWRWENLVPLSILTLFVTLGIFLVVRKFSQKNTPTQYR